MTTLKDIIGEHRARRRSSGTRRPLSEGAGSVDVIHTHGLNAATIALPAGISLEERVARLNEFIEKLVDFQRRDVLVVAICSPEDR